MNNPNPSVPPVEPAATIAPAAASASATNFTVGSTVVQSSSAEIAFALREEQFLMLCEGESSTDRSGRDLSIGLCVGAAVGFVGILAATDWATVWTSERRSPLIWSLGILFFIAAGSLVGAIICCVRLYRTRHRSSYSRLKKRMEEFFEGNQ